MATVTDYYPEHRMIKINNPGYNEEGQHSQIYDTLIFGYYGNNRHGKDAEYENFVGSIERGSIQFYMADGENIHDFIHALKTLNKERYGKIQIINGKIGILDSGRGRGKRSSKKRKGSVKVKYQKNNGKTQKQENK